MGSSADWAGWAGHESGALRPHPTLGAHSAHSRPRQRHNTTHTLPGPVRLQHGAPAGPGAGGRPSDAVQALRLMELGELGRRQKAGPPAAAAHARRSRCLPPRLLMSCIDSDVNSMPAKVGRRSSGRSPARRRASCRPAPGGAGWHGGGTPAGTLHGAPLGRLRPPAARPSTAPGPAGRFALWGVFLPLPLLAAAQPRP